MEGKAAMHFVLLRFAGYAVIFASVALYGGLQPWWQLVVGLILAGYGIWDRWKRPEDSPRDLRLGAWTEVAAIVAWSLISRQPTPLFMLVSPLMRSCVHLSAPEGAGLGLLTIGIVLAVPHQGTWMLWAQLAAVVGMAPYAYVMGALVREREAARRQLAIAALEQEQRLKNTERIRLARQLHDVMGQYWTAVIRGLDVALVTTDEQQRTFLLRSQEAAEQGLQAMREAVHNWNDGHQTPAAWLTELAASVERFRETVGITVSLEQGEIDWSRFADGAGAAEALTRVALESLTNAVRHGQASQVRIHLATDQKGVRLEVSDNGIGLAVARTGLVPSDSGLAVARLVPASDGVPADSVGLGVQSMRQLALAHGGTLTVESDHGTTITMHLPYAAQGAIAL